MKRPSSNSDTNWWTVAGALGVYLFGFGLLWLDLETFGTRYVEKLPEGVLMVIGIVYMPISYPLYWMGIIK